MKIFKKRTRGPILSKFDIFGNKVQEHWEPLEGKTSATQGYVRGVLDGSSNAIQLTKYHLIKKFKEKNKESKNITAYNKHKTTKYFRKLSQIYYFTVLAKKIYYLTATLKKIKKYIKVWSKQLIQNEIYFLKKAVLLAKSKEQLVRIYVKFKKNRKIYNKIYLKYIKAIYIQYLRILKKHKRSWSKMLIHSFTNKKFYKKRVKILPFLMFLKKRLFKKIRTGTHRNMRYWKKLIRKFAAKYQIAQEQDVTNITLDNLSNYQLNGVKEILNTSNIGNITPYVLLKYSFALRSKNRTEVFSKLRKMYYNLLIHAKLKGRKNVKPKKLLSLRALVAKKKWKRIKLQKLNKLSRIAALANKKKFYITNKGYLKRRGAMYASRLVEKEMKSHILEKYKQDVVSKVFLAGKISMWFVLYKNWNKMFYVSLLKKTMKRASVLRRMAKRQIAVIANKKIRGRNKQRNRLYKHNLNKKNKQLRVRYLRRLLRRLYKLFPTQLHNKIKRSLLKKILNLKKKKIIKRKRKLIRMLRIKKKGELKKRKKKRKYKFKFKYKQRRPRRKFKSKNRKKKNTRKIFKKSKRIKRKVRGRISRRISKRIRRGGRKYKNTAFLVQDYSGYWIDNLKKRTKFKRKKGKRSILKVSSKIRTWKTRRYLKKNYREMLNSRFNIIIRHKEIIQSTATLFTP